MSGNGYRALHPKRLTSKPNTRDKSASSACDDLVHRPGSATTTTASCFPVASQTDGHQYVTRISFILCLLEVVDEKAHSTMPTFSALQECDSRLHRVDTDFTRRVWRRAGGTVLEQSVEVLKRLEPDLPPPPPYVRRDHRRRGTVSTGDRVGITARAKQPEIELTNDTES
ncbi:hypothetical protein E8E13_006882 [Curvularia kusanoi]|uniref:Uncharacterized protein n=1 Tax=Curvularia kusanoi TaxID=90978 RepID=A0A9P4TCC1_CURKU|nr:hypothetical protein E8E13_006882 [Curvularia kusanoi]